MPSLHKAFEEFLTQMKGNEVLYLDEKTPAFNFTTWGMFFDDPSEVSQCRIVIGFTTEE